jgi:DNA-binding transcriptional MerR regulator
MKKPPKPKPETMTAAECARRTGLTVRALRVYERAGLLKPARSAKGWRIYGSKELVRLNTIVALKGFGLTLAQVRKAFHASPPVLEQVLDLQAKTWAARRVAAERAIGLIQSAIARLRTRADLSIDELCELMRKTEMGNMQSMLRELIDQHITPEQEREWMDYWARRDPAEVAHGQEQMDAFRKVADQFLAHLRDGERPDSAAVQALVERSNCAWLDSNLRQQQLAQLTWNPEVTRAWVKLGSKLLARSTVPDDAEEAARLERFMHEALHSSRGVRTFTPIVIEAMRLRDVGTRLNSREARQLALRYAQACRDEKVGDPVMHARWIVAFGEVDEASRAGWEYLAHLGAS